MLIWLRKFLRMTSVAQQDSVADAISTSPASAGNAIAAVPQVPVAAVEPLPASAPVGISWLAREDLNANFTSWLFVRSDYSDLQTNRAEQLVLDALDQILASPQSGTQLVRRMPGVIPQLLQSLRSNDFSGADLSRKIAHDVVLVAEVIRLANSSLYAKDDPITSLEHAVMVLGQNGLRHLITSVAFRPIIDLKSGYFNGLIAPRIWAHSEQCALASRLLAQQSGLNNFDAFLAGLIQNVGLIVSLRVMDQNADANDALGSAVFCNALIPKARWLSASIAREWDFPEAVVTAIEEQAIVQREVVLSAVGSNLSMADYLSKFNLMVQQGRQDSALAGIDGLGHTALDCYAELQALTSDAAANLMRR